MEQIGLVHYEVSGTGAISKTTTLIANGNPYVKLEQIKLTLANAASSGDTFTANTVAIAGSQFNASLDSTDMTGRKTYIATYDPPIILRSGDQLTFAFPNTATGAWGIEALYRGSN